MPSTFSLFALNSLILFGGTGKPPAATAAPLPPQGSTAQLSTAQLELAFQVAAAAATAAAADASDGGGDVTLNDIHVLDLTR